MDNRELVRRLRAEAEAWDSPHTVTGPSIASMLREAAAALESAEKDGFVLVPREPTHQMVEAGTMAGIAATWKEDGPVADARNVITAAVYKGMIDAALSAKGSS